MTKRSFNLTALTSGDRYVGMRLDVSLSLFDRTVGARCPGGSRNEEYEIDKKCILNCCFHVGFYG